MANISFETLYELCMREKNSIVYENMVKSYVLGCRENEGLLLEAKNYLIANLGNFSNYFKSTETEDSQHDKVKNMVTIMTRLAYAVDNHLSDLTSESIERLKKEDRETELYIQDLYEDFKTIEPQNLFGMSTDVIMNSYKAYYNHISEVSPKAAADAIAFIKRVKDDDALTKVFGSNNVDNMDISTILYSLFDYYNKDESKFDTETVYPFEIDNADVLSDYFTNMKNGNNTGAIDFKRYRPSLISKKATMPGLEKLIFARNIINLKRTGIMPSKDGFIDFFVDEEEAEDLSDKVSLIFNRRFDNVEFRKNQSSPIFSIEKSIRRPENFEEIKAARIGKGLAIGMLISSDSSAICEYMRQFYLLHVIIDDVSDEKCKYEIALSAIPDAKMDARIQLMRLDNYIEKGTHKNVAQKLDTTTHVHLYNHFDLLRGKTNGEYDIAHNLEEGSTAFSDSLQTFLTMMGANEALAKKVYTKTMKAIKSAERHLEM